MSRNNASTEKDNAIANLQKQNRALQMNNESLQSDNQRLLEQAEDNKKDKATEQLKRDEFQKTNDMLQEENQHLKAQTTALKEESVSRDKFVQELQEDNKVLKSECAKVQQSLLTVETHLCEMSKQGLAAVQLNMQLSNEAKTSRNLVTASQDQSRKEQTSKAEMLQKNKQLLDELETTRTKL